MCKKIVITGSNGFVGKNLNKYLTCNSNYSIISLDRKNLTGNQIGIQDNINAFVHLAGKAHDLKKTSNPQEYYDVNYNLTKELYDTFLISGAKKFIFVSSVKAVADCVDGVLTEETNPAPQTDYGKSKLMAEQYILNQSLPEGKSFYILRPCMIHGPGNKGNLNILYQFVSKGIPYPLGAFTNKRSFLSVGNLCFVIKEILGRNDIPVGVYQVSDDEPLSTNDLVRFLAASLNKKPVLWNIPKSVIKLLANVGDLFHFALTTERLEKLTENYVVSNKKIKNILNKPLPLTAKAGIKLTADSFSKE